MEQQNNINNIISPNQRTMRIDINDKANKHDKLIYTQTKLSAQNDNLKHHDTYATNKKYCAPINNSTSHSFIQQTRQLIYFISCGHTTAITLNNISLYYQNTQSELSHRQCNTKNIFSLSQNS